MNDIGTDDKSSNLGVLIPASSSILPPLLEPPSAGAYTTFNERSVGLGTIGFLRFLFCNSNIPIQFGDGPIYTDLGG
jgi:hypothetical protein